MGWALRLLSAVALLPLFLAAEPADEPKKARVREIAIKDLKRPGLPKGKWSVPAVISTVKELEKAFPEGTIRVRLLAKHVNLKEEKLLFFAWAGSGTDRLEFRVERGKDKEPVVVFSRQPGVTDDIRAHYRLFAVPRGMPVRFAKRS